MAKLKPQSDEFNGYFDFYSADDFSRFTGTVTGSNWYANFLRLQNSTVNTGKTIFSDADAGEGRHISYLELGWNSDVDLISTTIIQINGQAGKLHDVTLGSGYTETVSLHANKNVVTTGSGHTEMVLLRGAQNTVTTGDGWVRDISTDGAGTSTIDIGAGGAGTIMTGDGNDRLLFQGGVNSVHTGDGNDRLLIQSGVNSVHTGAGDDTVVTSGQWIYGLNLGAGDDTVVVEALDAWSELQIVASSNPKNGVDTLDFSKLEMGVRFELGNGGGWQEVYTSKKVDAWVSETGIENVIGTRKKDILTGGSLDNELTGGKGKDKLDGGNGDDSLYGGAQNDIFIFSGKFGIDTIHDFTTAGKGEKIDLSEVSKIKNFKDLSNNHLSDIDGNAVIDDHSGNRITLDGIAVSDLSANDFLF